MTLPQALFQLLIGPLELVFDVVYIIARELSGSGWISIFALSITVNLMLLPLYRRADAIQEAERAREAALAPWVSHIKKTFTGDERFMMLRTYYRQNRYQPFHALKGSLPLLLEIPFFIAAYHYLSHLEDLQGMPFGPIADLGAPDALLTVAGMPVHVLPVLMTLINLVSGALYTKGLPAKDKVQLYGMALLFLVLLYGSPSGIVIYWTINNLISLLRNLIRFLRGRRAPAAPEERKPPKAFAALRERFPRLGAAAPERADPRLFWGACILLALLTGVLIPSAVVASSPEEFVLLARYRSPLLHVLNAALLAAGTYLVWPGVVYLLSGKRGRAHLALLFWLSATAAIVNYMFFGTHMGTLSAELIYDDDLYFSMAEKLGNLALLLLLAAVLVWLWKTRRRFVRGACLALIVAVFGMSVYNVGSIRAALPSLRRTAQALGGETEKPEFTLSRNGKNVVVIMLDKAISSYLPYLFQEKPELAEQFEGFTYYPNTISYGPCTNIGVPAVYGGYEYTPEEMNRRADESLASKHNEALKLMPALFDAAGYEVTVCEPTYAGYRSIPDLSIYDDYPEIRTYLLESGPFDIVPEYAEVYAAYDEVRIDQIWTRNFFCFSFVKTAPVLLQKPFYNHGGYLNVHLPAQVSNTMSTATGLRSLFLKCYSVLHALPEMTQISDGAENTFVMMSNSTTHEPQLLTEPDYLPAVEVDNTAYDAAHMDRFTLDGRTMRMETSVQMQYYHVNMAAMLQFGAWMDYLRENGVYDNTRIIIAADHGRVLGQFDDMIFGTGRNEDVMVFNPLLLVKDFDSDAFTVDRSFMTNADVPTLAFADLIADPVNPFTGNPVNDDLKYAAEQHIFSTRKFRIQENNGNTFLPGEWYSVHDDIFDMDNWEKLGED